MEVNVLKLSNCMALWKTRYQNFFNHGGDKYIKTKQLYGFLEDRISKSLQPW